MKYMIITHWKEFDGYEYEDDRTNTRYKEKTVVMVYPEFPQDEIFSDIVDWNNDTTTVNLVWEGFIDEIKEIES